MNTASENLVVKGENTGIFFFYHKLFLPTQDKLPQAFLTSQDNPILEATSNLPSANA